MYTNIEEIRKQFPALSQMVYNKPLVYLDNSATAQKPQCVLDVMSKMNGGINGNIHRAVHYLSARCTEMYEEARKIVQDYIGAEKREEVIFTSGTTAGINMLAFSFGEAFVKAGDKIVVTVAEHHSNIVPWQMVCQRKGATLDWLDVLPNGELDLSNLEQKLQGAKILCVTHISNAVGYVNPIKEIVRRAHAMGVPVLVDGAQGIVHGSIDVKDTDVDFYVFSGHKIYGPTGTGILYGKEKYLEQMPPWQGGGDMIESVSLTKGTKYAALPLKFEAGTANYIGAAALGEALRFIKDIEPEFKHNHERSLCEYTLERLRQIEGLHIYGDPYVGADGGEATESEKQRVLQQKVALFSFNIEGIHPSDLAILLDQKGIAIRSGQLCAEPLLERFSQTAVARASFGIYNTIEEAEYLATSIQWAIKLLK